MTNHGTVSSIQWRCINSLNTKPDFLVPAIVYVESLDVCFYMVSFVHSPRKANCFFFGYKPNMHVIVE